MVSLKYKPNHILSVIYLNTEIVVSYSDIDLKQKQALVISFSDDVGNEAIYEGLNVTLQTLKFPTKLDQRLTLEETNALKLQLHFMLQIANMYGHDTILIKWTGQNAQHTAEVFHSELEKYKGVCKKIIFALGKSEYDVFLNVF